MKEVGEMNTTLEKIIQKEDEKKGALFKGKQSLLKAGLYPLVGAFPAEIRHKMQHTGYLGKIAKKYELDYLHDAPEIQIPLQALANIGAGTALAYSIGGPALSGVAFVYSSLAAIFGAAIRDDEKDDRNYFVEVNGRLKRLKEVYPYSSPWSGTYAPKGSFFTEWPYRASKRIISYVHRIAHTINSLHTPFKNFMSEKGDF